MKRLFTALRSLTVIVCWPLLGAIPAPEGLTCRVGDQCVVLHWDRLREPDLAGYKVYRAGSSTGPWTLLTPTLLTFPALCDFEAVNGCTNAYRITAVTRAAQESAPSKTLEAAARPFADDDAFLEFVQRASFDYFWREANPTNGLIPDRSPSTSPCSIAAVGFGLSALCVGVDRGWITRAEGAARVQTTLATFGSGPQGPETSGTIGHKGWFYHFLDMTAARRYVKFNTELSSIDTALLLAGVLHARQFFDQTNPGEASLRAAADAILGRVDWRWMAPDTDVLSMGWHPDSGFLPARWVGYNEAMLLCLLALGAASDPLPPSAWERWTGGYTWTTHYGHAFVPFPPLFGHQYSHCWVDFRRVADPFMTRHRSTYFENSRRATLAQHAYCTANPLRHPGYSGDLWGLTACDGPAGYAARGAPPALHDDGTIAPTAAGGSIVFAPELAIPTLRRFYREFRRSLWTPYGFRDAFNLGAAWWGPDTLGIDQGPFVLMIENHRTGRVWQRFMRSPEIQRGLARAGFVAVQTSVP
ncbi:MAG TPA: glucoamylase family protein [Verrucomicrobiota bacterium]|nr:glucoamylase family protein [Verrucomicrobiota bacterium]HNU50048.1 glucoamylase family protein [Verrucomicrobiota bacterium]